MKIKRSFCYGLLFLLVQAATALAVENPFSAPGGKETQPPATAEPSADDPLGRGTPQGTVLGFMRAMNNEDHERAVDYLDTKQSSKRAEQLAAELQFIIDRGLSGDLSNLSRNPEGVPGDGLPPNRERVGVVKAGSISLDILLERVERGDGPPIWLFSADTLRRVPSAYEQLDVPFLDRYLPGSADTDQDISYSPVAVALVLCRTPSSLPPGPAREQPAHACFAHGGPPALSGQ